MRTPQDVLAAVPYLLGFHPADSIVVLGLREYKLVFHARGDLPPPAAPPADIDGLARYLARIFVAQSATGVLLIGYGDPDRVSPTMLATTGAMRAAGLMVIEALRAVGGRYWSYECQDPSCCPPEGTAYDVAGSVIAAQATLAGCAALPDRESVVRTLGPPCDAALAAIEAATEAASRRLEHTPAHRVPPAGLAAVDGAVNRYAAGGRLTDEELAWLTALLTADPAVRDAAWARIESEHPRDAPLEIHERLWTDVVRRCSPQLAAPPGVLLAYACWRAGDGVRAGVAIDRALAAEPEYPAALLVAELLRRAVRPPLMRLRPGYAH